jgi:LemA protein
MLYVYEVMEWYVMWSYIFIAIIFLIIVYVFFMFNSFKKLNNKVKEAFSTMDVYLKKRWDLIPNIVEAVKGYSIYENSTLKEIVSLRNSNYDDMSVDDKINANEKLTLGINKIMALVESYPDLKTNDVYMELSNQLVKVEEDIANARKYYNGVIRMYNNKVEMFPNNILSKLLGFKAKSMFEAQECERNNVKVKL